MTDEKEMLDYPEAPCGECGRPTNRILIPKEELEALADEWSNPPFESQEHGYGRIKCAEELREVIEDHE